VPNTYGWDNLAATMVRRSQTAHSPLIRAYHNSPQLTTTRHNPPQLTTTHHKFQKFKLWYHNSPQPT
jgi:hypothetical protein